MSERLCESSLGQLPGVVHLPQYQRDKTGVGIVHLGVGAFHRAHQAWYTEQALNRFGGDWAIVGASLRSSIVKEQMQSQDGLYTIVERSGEGDSLKQRYQLCGAISQVLVGPEDPAALINQLSDPAIKIVTLTITEKGYLYNSAIDGLQLDHADVVHDLVNFSSSPNTAIGYLVAALLRRREQGLAGLTLLSCDNLPHNGRILQKVVLDFARKVDPALPEWIEQQVTFPSSMVDRIVPATTAEKLAELESTLGLRDEAAVFTEPFSQWVVENKFAQGSPHWADVGVLITDDVTPFETMKLRLLNGSHSLIAYLGFLAGYDYVHEVMADKSLSALVRLYMDEQASPTLAVPEGFDLAAYKSQLCDRFANAALGHKTYQIAQDGSQKIPQRWLMTVRECLAKEMGTDIIAFALAGWVRYLQGRRDNGETYLADDPLAERLQAAASEQDPVQAVMAIEVVFDDLVRTAPALVERVRGYYYQFETFGVLKSVEKFLES